MHATHRQPALTLSSIIGLALLLPACGGEDASGDPADATSLDAQVFDADPMPDMATGIDALPRPDMALEDAEVPIEPRVYVSVNEIPEAMMGLEPGRMGDTRRTFAWTVPPTGWTLEVTYEHPPGAWSPTEEPPYLLGRTLDPPPVRTVIDPETLDPPGGTWAEVRRGHRWQARVITPIFEGPGRYSLQGVVDELNAEPTPIVIGELTPEIDPFVETDDWIISFSRDLGRLDLTVEGEEVTVSTTPGADGTPDHIEALAAIGLLGGDAEWQAAVVARIEADIGTLLATFFAGVDIAFHTEGDPDLPPPEDQLAMAYSRIAIGGEDERFQPEGRSFFGRANLDWNNREVDDNTGPDRGVFTTAFVRALMGQTITLTLVRNYAPALGGTPFGVLPGDAEYLTPGFDPRSQPEGEARTRAQRFVFILDTWSLAVASVLAHEIAHSLGLVKPGFPPSGMLAEVDGPWVAQPIDGAHLDTPGFNLMQSGSSFSFSDALNGDPRFSAVSLSYLQKRLLLLP